MTRTFSISIGVVAVVLLAVFAIAYADASTFDFDSYALGTINGQDGWSSTGAVGSGCAVYDHTVSDSFGVLGFGTKSLRISNAVTSGCFGDQTFAKPLTDAVGEADSTDGTFSRGTLQNHFEAQFDIRPMQLSEQSGLFLSVSPDRGDGSRMSYLGFSDTSAGIDVIFYDTPGTGNPANFSPTTVATGLSRAVNHTAKFVIDFVDGPSNDVVKIYIDGVLAHTGTTWENYYRFDSEASAEPSPRIVKTLLFRTGGTAAPATAGLGYLIDNISLLSSIVSQTLVTVTIEKYVDNVHATAGNTGSASFPINASWDAINIGAGSGSFALSTVGFNTANPYEAVTADMTQGASYSLSEDLIGGTVGASCAEGKPFALVGYSSGDTEAEAFGAGSSASAPDLTGITTNKFIIVWNHACPPPSPPPPPADACSTPLVAPAGYTLQTGTNGNDTVTIAPFTMFVSLNGTDIVNGPAEGNYIVCTGNGNDTITLGNGNFTISAGNGNNSITTGNGDGTILTASANDKITTGNGVHTINAGSGNNTILTGDGNQTITTGNAIDKITTGGGDDVINAGGGLNTVKSGGGNDTVTTGSSNDNIDSGLGTDTCNAGGGINTVVNCEL